MKWFSLFSLVVVATILTRCGGGSWSTGDGVMRTDRRRVAAGRPDVRHRDWQSLTHDGQAAGTVSVTDARPATGAAGQCHSEN